MSDKPVMLFVELEHWEHEYLTSHCEHGCDIRPYSERFEEMPAEHLPKDASILSTFIYSDCSAEQLRRLPKLRLISTRSTGFNHIDLDYCRERAITVCNVPTYGENTVAEHAFALILALTRKIYRIYERTVRGDFSMEGTRGVDLEGKTFGCVGTGSIGLNALRIARGFNMRCIAFDVKHNDDAARRLGFEYVEMDTLLRESHVLSLHVPLNEKTRHLIDEQALSKMRDGAILVNTARGGLIDPPALIRHLRSGHLGGAALDVLEGETAIREEAELLTGQYDESQLRTIVQNHALLRLPNVIITPHVAFNSVEAVHRILNTTLDNVHAFLDGHPRNLVGTK